MTTGRKELVVILKEKAMTCAIIKDRFIKLTKRIEVIERELFKLLSFQKLNFSS
jgi:hypothetical protein